MKITSLYPNANQKTEYFVLSHVVQENKYLVNLVSRLNSLLTFTTKCTLIDLAYGVTFEVLIILLFLFVPRDHGHLIFSCLCAFFKYVVVLLKIGPIGSPGLQGPPGIQGSKGTKGDQV